MESNRSMLFENLRILSNNKLLSSLSSYANNRSLLSFACSNCTSIYRTTEFDYINGTTQCPSCMKTDVNDLITQLNHKHGGYYDYSRLTIKKVPTTIKQAKTNIIVICPKHGQFQVRMDQHLDGLGCNHCLTDNINHFNLRTNFILDANRKHGFRYRYDKITELIYLNDEVSVTCPKHGDFSVNKYEHLEGQGCPICTQSSAGITAITNKLTDMGVTFSTEKTFPGCISDEGRALRFDIYVPQKHLCIEYDCAHHFQVTKYSNDVTDKQAKKYFDIQIRNDEVKSVYCAENDIGLVRIPYTEYVPDAIIEKYITNLPNKRIIYSWNDFETDIHRIVAHIKTYNYSKFAVYGVARGGVPFSVHVSNHFNDMCEHGMIAFQRYDGTDKEVTPLVLHTDESVPIFILDDLISSGITMNKAINFMKDQFPTAPVHPIVIFGAHNDEGIFFIRKHPKQWVVFPYEV